MSATFRRAPDFDRRADMIEATLDCIADLGIQATTVRAVAARAGVSNGLIRHHFASKDNLILEAYRRIIEMMTAPPLEMLGESRGDPHERLARFVASSLSEPVADPRLLSLWATFVSQLHHDEQLAQEHRQGYLAFRQAGQQLIADVLRAEGRLAPEAECHRLAIAFNALIDGLWLEGCLVPDEINTELRIGIGLKSVESLLGIKLAGAAEQRRS